MFDQNLDVTQASFVEILHDNRKAAFPRANLSGRRSEAQLVNELLPRLGDQLARFQLDTKVRGGSTFERQDNSRKARQTSRSGWRIVL